MSTLLIYAKIQYLNNNQNCFFKRRSNHALMHPLTKFTKATNNNNECVTDLYLLLFRANDVGSVEPPQEVYYIDHYIKGEIMKNPDKDGNQMLFVKESVNFVHACLPLSGTEGFTRRKEDNKKTRREKKTKNKKRFDTFDSMISGFGIISDYVSLEFSCGKKSLSFFVEK